MPERPAAVRLLALAVLIGLGFALAVPFATWPRYRHLGDELAVVKLGFDHEGQRAHPCRQLGPEEIAALPQHKRKTEDCPRGRLPVLVEVLVDGQPLFRVEEPPTGLAGDGASRFYERAGIASGGHEFTLRLRDTARTDGYDYERVASVDLAPAQVLVIGFDSENSAFTLR